MNKETIKRSTFEMEYKNVKDVNLKYFLFVSSVKRSILLHVFRVCWRSKGHKRIKYLQIFSILIHFLFLVILQGGGGVSQRLPPDRLLGGY